MRRFQRTANTFSARPIVMAYIQRVVREASPDENRAKTISYQSFYISTDAERCRLADPPLEPGNRWRFTIPFAGFRSKNLEATPIPWMKTRTKTHDSNQH